MANEDPTLVKPVKTALALRSLETAETFPLEGEMLVGREVECAIILDSRQISRYHAKILVAANEVFIEDLHSSNGTYVNGRRIDSRIALSLGDEVAFDEQRYRVTSRQSGAAAVTELATAAMKRAAAVPPPADPEPAPAPRPSPEPAPLQRPLQPPADGSQPDSTRMLSAERKAQIDSLNQRFQKDVDLGSGPRLVVMTAPIRGQVFSLDNDRVTQWRIGRDPQADIRIQEKSVSRDHARLTRLDGAYHIAATKAANGVSINGEATPEAQLRHGDKIQVGRITLVFKTDRRQLQAEAVSPLAEGRRPPPRALLIIALAMLLALLALLFSVM